MNAQPHTHEVKIVRDYAMFGQGDGAWLIRYGDTEVKVQRGPFLRRRLRRGVKRAIRRHDKGSIRAGRDAVWAESLRGTGEAYASEWSRRTGR